MIDTKKINELLLQLPQDRKCTVRIKNIGSLSWIHCCRGKEMSFTYSTCVFVALFVRHTKGSAVHIVICGLSCSTIIFHIIS